MVTRRRHRGEAYAREMGRIEFSIGFARSFETAEDGVASTVRDAFHKGPAGPFPLAGGRAKGAVKPTGSASRERSCEPLEGTSDEHPFVAKKVAIVLEAFGVFVENADYRSIRRVLSL